MSTRKSTLLPTTSLLLALALTSTLAPTLVSGATYDLIQSASGSNFFDASFWEFATGYDNTTNGDTVWSSSSQLAYVNSAGRAIIKVDNTSEVAYNYKRNSVKLYSTNYYKPNTVFVMDLTHMPYGCSVWPAWWTQGTEWPEHGEIDIIEPVNLQVENQYALHTTAGCTASANSTLGTPTGTYGDTNCDQDANYGSGCTVKGGLAGSAFAEVGGGVYVMSFETTGINIWFYQRSDIPSSLSSTASTIDTSTLGTPIASYSSSTCDISTFFGSQQMTLNIVTCGDYAGLASVLEETCPALVGDQTCYTTYVLNSTVYDNAYFEINYLNVYGTDASIDTTLSPSSAGTTGRAETTDMGSATGTSSGQTSGTTTAGLIGASNLVGGAGKLRVGMGSDGWRVVMVGLGAVGLTIGIGFGSVWGW